MIDGEYPEFPDQVTLEEFYKFEKSEPAYYGIEALLAFVKKLRLAGMK